MLSAEKVTRKYMEFQPMDASRILPLRMYVRVKDVCLDSISSLGVGGRWGSIAKNRGQPPRGESRGRKKAQDRVPEILESLRDLNTEFIYYSKCDRNSMVSFGKVTDLV